MLTDHQITVLHRALTEFGYNIDEVRVRDSALYVMGGGKERGIVDMFVKGWLKEAGLLS